MISTFELKKRLTSEEPREVFDLMRWMPGMPFIASSMGRVTETSVCGAGATPLSTMITMRGKSVAGKIAIGKCQAAYNPPAQIRAFNTSTARDWFETRRARFMIFFWSAVAERSGDTALDSYTAVRSAKNCQTAAKAPSPLRSAGALQRKAPHSPYGF